MYIRDMFVKPIDRDIKGVIKVGQAEEENVKQELEEYVVTRELEKHFRDFFTSYKRGINGTTDKVGVWISGFFGSGKSHFLKIISYLLDDRRVDGKRAIDYFVEDQKVHDRMVLADMQLASTIPTDVILFNIGSKGDTSGGQSKDAIVSVFLRAFNEKLGFCGMIPHLADLERWLTEQGKYEAFKETFEETTGQPWVESRNDFDFIQDDVVEVLSGMGVMSEDAARNWCEKASGNYSISIEDFAKLVQRYIEKQGNNHHVVFLVDEIGQYIGEDSNLMLDLQTVTEDLGRFCLGKAWVIVTSQQDIDSITNVRGNDFSKIQGRFDTRLSLTSANVDEVIRERILKKNEAGRQTLSVLYDDMNTVLKNLILFTDGVERKIYTGAENFADVYPFVTYQFNLLGEVLTAVRTYGASGKHLSEGERSMLAMFKDAAEALKDREQGALVPFHLFYNPLERFLDNSHSSVITRALDLDVLNPDHAEECFDVNVLKVLFLVKYIKGFRANSEQITSLMVSHVQDDRLELKRRVEDALKRLEKQTLIQKNGDCYVFLTNEEQEINQAIAQQDFDSSEVTAEIAKMIFDDIYDERKYRHPAHNGRYQFAFNQMVDERSVRPNQSAELTLRILTPNSEESRDDSTLRIISSQNRCVLVVLPEDRSFITEIQTALQIEKYFRLDAGNSAARYAEIKDAKKRELMDRKSAARIYLEEALKEAAIYVGGDRIQTASREIKPRINEALGRQVALIYHKLNYITYAASEGDIRNLLRQSGRQITMGGPAPLVNELALKDVAAYIEMNTNRHQRTSMKTLLDRFTKAPYGFVEADVQWLVTKLFTAGDIAFFVNSEPVTQLSKTEEEILRFVTRREYVDRLMTDKKEKATDRQKRAAREVMRELFGVASPTDDDEALMTNFLNYAKTYKEDLAQYELHYQGTPRYPGRQVVAAARSLMTAALAINYSAEFYGYIDREQDRFLDLAEDMAQVKQFFASEQRGIFDKALMWMKIYSESRNFLADDALSALAGKIDEILRMERPYRRIVELPGLCQEFQQKYDAILDGFLDPAKEAIADARKRVFDELEGKRCKAQLADGFVRAFDELKQKAEATNNVAELQNIRIEADALKVNLLNRIARTEAALTPPPQPDADGSGAKSATVQPAPAQKQAVTVSIKSVTSAATWQIETEADVDAYVETLRRKLKGMLASDTVYHIEF